MKFVVLRSILILVVLMMISSTSHANLKKGRIAPGTEKVFELIPPADGVSNLSLIFDAGATDLDLLVGLDDGTVVAASISPESFFEVLTLGLVAQTRFLVVVDHFEGPASPFRMIVNSGEQQVLRMNEVQANAASRKLVDALHKIQRIKK